MIVTAFTRDCLAFRRDRRRMEALGYRMLYEPFWQMRRGASMDVHIIDVKIGQDRQSIWVKLDKELET